MSQLQRAAQVGRKEIWFPKFTIALMRTPNLSPYLAKFQVPLNFSKFDLKDYLHNVYNVRAFRIRSSIQQQPVRDSLDQPGHLFRPQAKKFMTIEMDKPFVWPEKPEDWEPWAKDRTEEKEEKERKRLGVSERQVEIQKDQRVLMGQARRVLEGGEKEWERRRTDTYSKVEEEAGYKIRV